VSEPWDEYDVPPMWSEEECLPLDRLHPLIHEASRRYLDLGQEGEAVLGAWTALRDLLRARLKSHEDGMRLIEEIGPAQSARLNLTPNQTLSQRNQHEGIRHMLRGLVAYARNPMAHDSLNPFAGDFDEAIQVLAIMSLVAEHVESAGTAADVDEAVELLCEPDVPLDGQAIAAAVARAGRSQSGPLVERIIDRLRTRPGGRAERALLTGYHLVLSRNFDPVVFERAGRVTSQLLMKAETTALGLKLLREGVVSKLDPFAYAKVVSLVRIALEGGASDEDKLALPRAGQLAALMLQKDRDRLARTQLDAIRSGAGEEAAKAVHFLVRALPEDNPEPTAIQRAFIQATAGRLCRSDESELDEALRADFPFPSMSFNLYLLEGFRKAKSENGDCTRLDAFLADFGSVNRWPRR